MFIIFIAHLPFNGWREFIPARFGFSDATEIFVFCSGMASAIAFGRLFEERGFVVGTSRIAYRCWQVYWAHISIVFLVTATMIAFDRWLDNGGEYLRGINLVHLVEGDSAANILGLFTLTYVPNLFDILPMYLVILAMLPIVMALRRLGRIYVFAAMGLLWLLATTGQISLPAEPWTDRVWFFNPFAWQLVFFTGFAFIRGWIPPPPVDRRAMIAAAVFLVATIPLAHSWFLSNFQIFADARHFLSPLLAKSGFGLLRYMHFLCLAYLAYSLAGAGGQNLLAFKGPAVKVICKVGQQALGVYLAGQFLAMIGGIYLNELGHTVFNTALVNIVGIAALIAVAYTVSYFKSAPWNSPSAKAQGYQANKPAVGKTSAEDASSPGFSTRRAGQPAE